MNDLDNDPYLGPALRDRVKSEAPDLERLASMSLSAGTHLRRRRRIGATAGAVAGVAVIALATSQLGGGTTASDPGPADAPTAAPSEATTTVTADPEDADGLPTGAEPSAELPIKIDAPGWKCESFPIDDKAYCTKGNRALSVVVRSGADYDDWKGQADKGADPSTLWMSPKQDDYFITVQGTKDGVETKDLDDFIKGITFSISWAAD